jgi:hypothetical protein
MQTGTRLRHRSSAVLDYNIKLPKFGRHVWSIPFRKNPKIFSADMEIFLTVNTLVFEKLEVDPSN